MIRKNKKGMTSIEFLAAFAIISVIVVGLFDVVLNYKNRQQIEAIYSEVNAYINSLQKVVQDDLIKKHLTSASVVRHENEIQANLVMNNPSTSTSFIITPGSYTGDLEVSSKGLITYASIKYPLPDIPDLIIDNSSTITIEELAVSDSLKISFLKIHIVLRHPNFSYRIDDKEYGIYDFDITCPINYSN